MDARKTMAEKLLTPQQELFLSLYTDPKSDTFSNALQSALRAGYSQEYSENITGQLPDWLSENLGRSRRVMKAEKNLDLALEGMLDDPEKGKKEIQWKATEMTLKTQGKDLGYTERQELVGKDGKDLMPDPLTEEEKDKLLNLIK